jgi:hypothetical protein
MSHHSKISKPQETSKYLVVIPLIIATLAICFLCGLAVWLPQMSNNQRLQRFSDGLYDYPLPPETEVLDKSSAVTLLGNGNHCDFMATQSLVSKLNRKELEMYYQNVGVPIVSEDSLYNQRGLVPVRLEFDEINLSDGLIRFTVTAIDAGYPAGFDIRCH